MSSKPFPAASFLTGGHEPWPMEGEIADVVVEGDLPRQLCGTLWRNGPNPQFAPRGRYHWFDGDGMIHAFQFRDGRVAYRNRWVRTARFQLERAAGEALFGGLADFSATDPRVMQTSMSAANTNIVWHAGRLLALWEAGPPHLLDPYSLETLGPYDFGGRLAGPMTAHPKVDPETGEMLFFGYDFVPPFLRYHVLSADGRLAHTREIEVPFATMMHDFIVTRNYVVFMVCPATLRLEHIERWGSPVGWEPELGTRLGVMPRAGTNAEVKWFETDPCYVFHPMNAYEENGRLVADVCRYATLPLFAEGAAIDSLAGLTARLTRWTIDLARGGVRQEPLDDMCTEFPRFDERHAGLGYRHGYAAGIVPAAEPLAGLNAIVHYDHTTGRRREHRLPSSDAASEPVFVPRAHDAGEGDGFLLAVVYRGEDRRSDLLVLDAQDVAAPPLATVKLPHRVPVGFHGNWGEEVSR